jgi:hypothetical protein
MTTTKKATSKYTPAMEAAIRSAAEANGGSLNLKSANDLAATAEFVKAGITGRGIAAKCRSMTPPVGYEKAERVSKDGSAVAKKDEIVAKIAKAIGADGGLASLAKAEKRDLAKLYEAVTFLAANEAMADAE